MDDKIASKVYEYIDAIARKLGVAAEHVYTLLVRQQIVDGVIGILLGIVLMLIAYFSIKRWIPELDKDDYEFLGQPLALLAGACGIVGLVIIFHNIGPLINPEYYAIKEIMSFVSGK